MSNLRFKIFQVASIIWWIKQKEKLLTIYLTNCRFKRSCMWTPLKICASSSSGRCLIVVLLRVLGRGLANKTSEHLFCSNKASSDSHIFCSDKASSDSIQFITLLCLHTCNKHRVEINESKDSAEFGLKKRVYLLAILLNQVGLPSIEICEV